MNYADRVQDSFTTTGTGAITLAGAAPLNFQVLPVAWAVGAAFPYSLAHRTLNEWEEGVGTVTGTNTFSRAPTASSSSGNLVNFSAGTKDFSVALTSAQIAKFATADATPFATAIPLTQRGSAFMPQTTVTGALGFTAAASPVQGALVYLRLVADGTNAPTFPGFKEWGGSLGYDNRNGIVNEVQFFYDGYDCWYSISQAVGAVAVPAAATGVTLTGPTSGVVSIASTDFTLGVTPVGGTITGTVRITPASTVPGDTFTPAFRDVSTGTPSGTFSVTPSTTGARTISATNNGGLANPANLTYTASAAATAPAQMAAPTATAGAASASVVLVAPSDGGSAITGYTVTSNPAGGVDSAAGTTALTRTITGLTPNTAYTFTATATNTIGTSPASPASNSVTPTAAASATQARLTTRSLLTESGTGPWTYTSNGGGDFSGTAGGLLADSAAALVLLGTSSTVQFTLSSFSSGNDTLVGFLPASASALANFTTMPYALYANSPNYQLFATGTSVTPNGATIAVAASDVIQIVRSGTTIVVSVSKNAGSSWTVLHTWSGVPASSYRFEAICRGNGAGAGAISNILTTGAVVG